MKVAVYNGFPFHYEMIGYIFEYFYKTKNIIPSFYNLNQDNLGWIWFYSRLYENIFINKSINKFNPEKYDIIFLLTDNDLNFKEEWIDKYSHKIICIDHYYYLRRPSIKYHIATRLFPNRNIPYIIPCFEIYNLEYKVFCLSLQAKINVSILGMNIPKNIQQLTNLFINFNDIQFYCMSRSNIISRHGCYPSNNICYCIDIPTSAMMDILKNSHYILCLSNNPDHIDKSLSASIFLSFSIGSKLIMPKIWNNFHQLKTPILYDINDKIELQKNYDLKSIYSELYYLSNQRNIIFDSIINQIMKS